MRRLSAAATGLLLALGGASMPGHAETAAPVLVPATIQTSNLEARSAPFDTLAAPQGDAGETATLPAEDPGQDMGTGIASWYGTKFAGRRTASGERFDPSELTAAHRTLPFGSKVRVTNTGTGQSVVVRINDRGPFSHGRLIDVSQAAARELGLIGPGSGEVSLSLIED